MKNTLTILFLLLAINAGAQKIRFADSTNQWTTLSFSSASYCSFQNSFSYGPDTMVMGKTYRPLREQSSIFVPASCFGSGGCMGCCAQTSNYLIREDTMKGIVYYINPVDTTEDTLYNYNLGIGDTIVYRGAYAIYIDTVVTVDSILINGLYHKIYKLADAVDIYSLGYTVLEGIGCTNNPVFPAWMYGSCFEYGESLVCFYEHGVCPPAHAPINSCTGSVGYPCGNISLNSFNNLPGCVAALGTSNINSQAPSLTITPNPAYNQIEIMADSHFGSNTNVVVFDMNGRCILRAVADDQKNKLSINTMSWPDGLYMVIVQNDGGVVKKEKVVVRK